MSARNADNRSLVVMPDTRNGKHGFSICRVGECVFVTEEVLTTLAFGNSELTSNISFKRLMDEFTRECYALANTPDWDKNKKARHIKQLNQLLARGCSSWLETGLNQVRSP